VMERISICLWVIALVQMVHGRLTRPDLTVRDHGRGICSGHPGVVAGLLKKTVSVALEVSSL
jgi:hypothetical protein